MKTLTTSLVCFAVAFCGSGCGTLSEQAANGMAIAGSDFAVVQLSKDPNSLKGLQDFAAALPKIPLGQVTPYDLGVLNRELRPLTDAKAAKPNDADAFTRVGNLISTASQSMKANPTIYQGQASAIAQQFANGILVGIQFYNGQHSISP